MSACRCSGTASPWTLTLTRDVIERSAVQATTLADGRVGLVRVDGFSSGAADDLRTALEEQLAAGAQGVILDLRDDPGGYVDAALEVASQFVADGPIYWDEYADGTTIPHEALDGGVATDPAIPVVVLVNGGTASASEIVAGALGDAGRATLVGETTFGKGTVQQWHLLSGEAGGFRLSVAKWLTPDKTWVHGVGITPDVAIEPGASDGSDAQLDRALGIVLAALDGAPSPSLARCLTLDPARAPISTARLAGRVLTAPWHRPRGWTLARRSRSGYRQRERKEVMCSDGQ